PPARPHLLHRRREERVLVPPTATAIERLRRDGTHRKWSLAPTNENPLPGGEGAGGWGEGQYPRRRIAMCSAARAPRASAQSRSRPPDEGLPSDAFTMQCTSDWSSTAPAASV